jgi:hypothetical protein
MIVSEFSLSVKNEYLYSYIFNKKEEEEKRVS